ncbi:hypothetical protein BLNAU_20100 [Blattamonas nauphoetae]|uniref:Uncharacterized protein n=1 Tax=Blattamonas nauphoetae TaxID=2049346 RepID=A0ABQ9X224_9EUKA|nr:hypothetical protein BLNAU_20100 [Blattamonas nauphoetae]
MPSYFNNIAQASPPFISLVDFIKEGKTLDINDIRQACTLLDKITPQFGSPITADNILFDLVPKVDGSCTGLSESLFPLLTSSNEALIKSTLSLLNVVIFKASPSVCFDFLQTGLFALLPPAFFQHDLRISAQPRLFCVNIVHWLRLYVTQVSTGEICRHRNISMDAFQQMYAIHFFRPIEQFLDFFCRHFFRINSYEDLSNFSELFQMIIESSPLLEQMMQFVLSSVFTLSLTANLLLFEPNLFSLIILRRMVNVILGWQKGIRAVQKREQQIMAKLREDGISDEIELHFRASNFDLSLRSFVSVGTRLIHMVGGNAPFEQSEELHEVDFEWFM